MDRALVILWCFNIIGIGLAAAGIWFLESRRLKQEHLKGIWLKGETDYWMKEHRKNSARVKEMNKSIDMNALAISRTNALIKITTERLDRLHKEGTNDEAAG